jgi:hypothetical protein
MLASSVIEEPGGAASAWSLPVSLSSFVAQLVVISVKRKENLVYILEG